jgi:integrase/recombinase XerD
MPETTELVVIEDPSIAAERMAVAGFLAGYSGSTRRSYGTDVRLFATWCREGSMSLFTIRRAHLELFARWMEENGRMRSTVGRRLSTLAAFYRYCEQERLIDCNPALNVGGPRSTTSPARWDWIATSSAPSWSGPDPVLPVTTRSPRYWRSTDSGSAKPWVPTSATWTLTGAHARCGSCARVASTPPCPSHLGRRGPWTSGNAPRVRSSLVNTGAGWIAAPQIGQSSDWPGGRGSPSGSRRTACRHSFITAALDAGVVLRDVKEAASHADPRTTMRYDRARRSLDRHATYVVAAFVAEPPVASERYQSVARLGGHSGRRPRSGIRSSATRSDIRRILVHPQRKERGHRTGGGAAPSRGGQRWCDDEKFRRPWSCRSSSPTSAAWSR